MKVKNILENNIVVLVNGLYQKKPGEEFEIHGDHEDHSSVSWALERNWIQVVKDAAPEAEKAKSDEPEKAEKPAKPAKAEKAGKAAKAEEAEAEKPTEATPE